MYIIFTEEQGENIRDKYGMSVIEYKYYIKKGCDLNLARLAYNVAQVLEILIDTGKKITQALYDFADDLKMTIEDIRYIYGARTSRRYKFVKFLSKLGYDKRSMWVATRHTWLARSDC